MKIYYNFDKKHRNFSLAPTGPCFSDETSELFVEGVDLEKYRSYPDCACTTISGTKFNIYVIIYEDGMRDYINGNDPKAMQYYTSVRTKMGNNKYNIKESSYYKFGYRILENSYEIDGTLFIETCWTQE